jgi:hypothetical protein
VTKQKCERKIAKKEYKQEKKERMMQNYLKITKINNLKIVTNKKKIVEMLKKKCGKK